MIKIITYGQHTATLDAYLYPAILITDEKKLPVRLADMLNETTSINVQEVKKNISGGNIMEITHDLCPGDLLAAVCDAITRVYNTDIAVSNARP